MSNKQFSMSMYLSAEDLYKAKAKYYQELCESLQESNKALEEENKKHSAKVEKLMDVIADEVSQREHFQAKLGELESANEWISVDTKLPPRDVEIWAYHEDWGVEVCTMDNCDLIRIGISGDIAKVWMPLNKPSPPKG